jgi:hypothetical protein
MKYSIQNILAVLVFVGCSSALADPDENSPGGMYIPPGVNVGSIDSMNMPDAIKNMSKKQHAQMKERGFADASEEEVVVLERYALDKNKKYIKEMSDVLPELAIQPSTLSGQMFERAKFKGAMVSGGYTKNGWTGVTRLYRFPQLGLVKLDELDYIASGSGIIVAKEFIDEIDGKTATYMVKRSLSGKSLSELTWFTESKMFTLSASGLIKKDDKRYAQLVEIAREVR